jgi:hypothetical protein
MEWMNAYVEPVENMGSVLHEQHVITLATEAALDAQESLDIATGAALVTATNTFNDQASDLRARVTELEGDNATLVIAVVGLALASAAVGVLSLLCVFRLSNKKQFAHSISGLPIVTSLPTLAPTLAGNKEIDLGKA